MQFNKTSSIVVSNISKINEITHTNIQISIQYILVSTYVIITWGTYNHVSILSKLMLMYLYFYS